LVIQDNRNDVIWSVTRYLPLVNSKYKGFWLLEDEPASPLVAF